MNSIIQDYNLKDGHIISKILQYYNIPVRSTGYISKTDQTLFKKISNEILAYTLGLITADGSIGKNYEITITLKQSDEILLKQINQQLLHGTGTIAYDNRENKKTYKLRFFGKQICENLKQYDVIPNKTYSLEKIQVFSEPIMKHYIRGLYDGDGICTKNKEYLRIGFCGYSKSFVESFQHYLVDTLQIKANKIFKTSCWNCLWGAKKDLEILYNYLYEDSTIFLSRKKDKLQKYLYDNTEVTS